MHIAVCVKQIPDPEIAASQFRVDEQAKQIVPLPGTALVQQLFSAVEATGGGTLGTQGLALALERLAGLEPSQP